MKYYEGHQIWSIKRLKDARYVSVVWVRDEAESEPQWKAHYSLGLWSKTALPRPL